MGVPEHAVLTSRLKQSCCCLELSPCPQIEHKGNEPEPEQQLVSVVPIVAGSSSCLSRCCRPFLPTVASGLFIDELSPGSVVHSVRLLSVSPSLHVRHNECKLVAQPT